jgi:hypothetical protein
LNQFLNRNLGGHLFVSFLPEKIVDGVDFGNGVVGFRVAAFFIRAD